MALFAMIVTAGKVPKDVTKGEIPHNDYAGMVLLTGGWLH